jgi:Trk K+ transport system NAD-binding subunit
MTPAPPATDDRARRPRWSARLSAGLAGIARTTPGRLALLVAMVVVIWLVTAAAAALADAESSYGMALWSGLRHLFDPGSLGDDTTTAQRIIGVIQVFSGLIFLAGIAFTVLADSVDAGLRRLSESEPPVTTAGHLLVIGAGDMRAAVMAGIGPGMPAPVVVLAPSADTAVTPVRGRVISRVGDARDPAVLARAGAGAAGGIVVAGGSSADAEVADLTALETVGALLDQLPAAGGPLVAVHVEHARNIDAIWSLLPPAFDAVPGDRNVGAILALAVALPEYPSLLTAATGGTGSAPFVVPAGELAGLAFASAVDRCPGGTPMGLLRGDRALYAPSPDTVIGAEDGVIVLAPDRAAAQLRREPPAAGATAAPADLPVQPVAPGSRRVLALGWSPVGADLVTALDGSTDLTVLAQLETAPPGLADDSLRMGDPGDLDAIAAAMKAVRPEMVVVLAGANGAPDQLGAHARAALSALKVSGTVDRDDLTIIVEQHASDRARRLRSADRRIQVLSRAEMVAFTLLLSATDRPGLRAHEALALDPDLSIRAVRHAGADPVPRAAACRALLEQRVIPLSLSRGGEEFDLLDSEAAVIEPGDGLLVLHRA